jgi:hypothetical protein
MLGQATNGPATPSVMSATGAFFAISVADLDASAK